MKTMNERFDELYRELGLEDFEQIRSFIESEIELAKEEEYRKMVDKVRYRFNGYGGALGFTEGELLDLILNNNEK